MTPPAPFADRPQPEREMFDILHVSRSSGRRAEEKLIFVRPVCVHEYTQPGIPACQRDCTSACTAIEVAAQHTERLSFLLSMIQYIFQ
mmetsp:Transcript_9902/g.41914  ORF Transcript_9902/g.41914 Transcript_9902/m.41914 type:complete len:88 (+) Transcript_9902:803-1066(+)